MEITEEQLQLVITVLDQANQDLHAEFCYTGHCSCRQREEVIAMLQNIQRTTTLLSKSK
jgi:hypothetical protein